MIITQALECKAIKVIFYGLLYGAWCADVRGEIFRRFLCPESRSEPSAPNLCAVINCLAEGVISRVAVYAFLCSCGVGRNKGLAAFWAMPVVTIRLRGLYAAPPISR